MKDLIKIEDWYYDLPEALIIILESIALYIIFLGFAYIIIPQDVINMFIELSISYKVFVLILPFMICFSVFVSINNGRCILK